MNELDIAIRVGIAGLAGFAVGVEREWSGHATGPAARFAGVRTFFLLGVVGGIAGWLSDSGGAALGVALAVVAGLLVAAAYQAATRRNPADVDGTTEVAAIAVLAIGALAGRGYLAVSGGAAATVLLFLSEKASIRKFIETIEDREIRAAFHFAVLALVVLPVLPVGPYGPYDAIRPRMIWTVVLIFSALNFAGYVARRVVGEAKGFLITGALGGLISSTAVTLAYARRSRLEPQHATALAAGTVAASTVLILRILAVTLALNPAFTPRAAVWLAGMLLVALTMTVFAATRPQASSHDHPSESANPLQLGTAVKLALAFQLAVLAIDYLRAWFGELGVFAGAALAGLTDMDALTMSLSRLAKDGAFAETAAAALVIGVVANTVLKTVAAVALGESSYRRKVVPALGLMGLAAGFTWWWLRRQAGPGG
jgi:uncharacterized membrane protein (DUF4010 family)